MIEIIRRENLQRPRRSRPGQVEAHTRGVGGLHRVVALNKAFVYCGRMEPGPAAVTD